MMNDVIMDLSTLISKLKDKSPFKYNFSKHPTPILAV